MRIKITADSTCDLSKELLAKYDIPVIPLPNPGEGGAVNPGNSGGIAIQPLPDYIVTGPARYAAVRFLNASHGYPAFRIFIDGTRQARLPA